MKSASYGIALIISTLSANLSAEEAKTGTLIPNRDTTSMVQAAGFERVENTKEDKIEQRMPKSEVVKTFHEFAKCVVDQNPKGVSSAFEIVRPSSQQVKAGLWPGSAGNMSKCLGKSGGGQLSVNYFTYVGAWAEKLYTRTYDKLPVLPQGVLDPRLIADNDNSNIHSLMLADCVVRRAGANVDYVMRTDVGSEFEKSGLAALSPFLSECLTEGTQARFDRFSLRLVLANALYQRASGYVKTSVAEAAK